MHEQFLWKKNLLHSKLAIFGAVFQVKVLYVWQDNNGVDKCITLFCFMACLLCMDGCLGGGSFQNATLIH